MKPITRCNFRSRASRALSRSLPLLLGIAVNAPLAQANTTKNYLLVESLESKDVQVVDPVTRKTVKNIPIGAGFTDDVMGSPDGSRFYVGVQDNANSPFGHQTNESGRVIAFDTETQQELWTLSIDGSPHHLAQSPDGKRIYVPMFNRNWILELDADTGTIQAWWPSIIGNHSIEMSRDGKYAYAGNIMTGAVYVYDTDKRKLVMAMDSKGQEGIRPMVIDDDRGLIYMQLSKLHGFEVRRLDTGEYVRTVELPPLDEPIGRGKARNAEEQAVNSVPSAFPYTYNHGLDMTPDGKMLLAAATTADYVAVYSLPAFELKGTVPVGDAPNWIVADGDNRFAYVSNPGDNTVSVIDLQKIEEVEQISVGSVPQRITMSIE